MTTEYDALPWDRRDREAFATRAAAMAERYRQVEQHRRAQMARITSAASGEEQIELARAAFELGRAVGAGLTTVEHARLDACLAAEREGRLDMDEVRGIVVHLVGLGATRPLTTDELLGYETARHGVAPSGAAS